VALEKVDANDGARAGDEFAELGQGGFRVHFGESRGGRSWVVDGFRPSYRCIARERSRLGQRLPASSKFDGHQ
jgi:hypothetical protein